MYYSFLDSCGGHTSDYHYHLNLDCLYPHEAGSTSQRAVESLSARLHRHNYTQRYTTIAVIEHAPMEVGTILMTLRPMASSHRL